MQFADIIRDPAIYPEQPRQVEVVETHISWVCLTGTYVYKFKKPVDMGFLDFSSIEKRHYYCHEEVRLNSRLSPSLYEGVHALCRDRESGNYRIDDEGHVVEYAVKMRQLPQEQLMKELLQVGKVSGHDIDRLARMLVRFYAEAATDRSISAWGKAGVIDENTEENFAQTEDMIGWLLSASEYREIRSATRWFLRQYATLFDRRVREGFIREAHGDLHSGNIFIADDIYIFDGIEFNERIKNGDVASDIAFLAMDLDERGGPEFSRRLIHTYVQQSGDLECLKLLSFYKCYRAYVRGKVSGFQLQKQDDSELRAEAEKYFQLALDYARHMLYRYAEFDPPIVCIMSGYSASGKSTVAAQLGEMLGAPVLRTDRLRRELYADQQLSREELYTRARRDAVYEEMMRQADEALERGESVILDAAFLSGYMRQRARELAGQHGCGFIIVYTDAPDDVIRQRLQERAGTDSDADVSVYEDVERREAEAFEDPAEVIEVDASREDAGEQAWDALIERFAAQLKNASSRR